MEFTLNIYFIFSLCLDFFYAWKPLSCLMVLIGYDFVYKCFQMSAFHGGVSHVF